MTGTEHVELLVAYANSVDHDEGTDDLTTPAELSRWLRGHGLLSQEVRSTPADLALALRLRDALHRAMVGNHDGASDRPRSRGSAMSCRCRSVRSTVGPGCARTGTVCAAR